ncbi:MAG TPA: 2-hydroxychromene-2-carboxylate isomerase [Usitatibacter sp.]|nr:2-hydroxychromene-2-carboxylate isomerase [Usitatibacter sp.]
MKTGDRPQAHEPGPVPSIDWYFDFVSPYSYLQCERLAKFPARINPQPLVFAGLLKHWGHKGPAEMPSKRTFIYRQVQWLAARDGVAMRFPPRHPFNPIRALRLAIAMGSSYEAVRMIFRHIWRDGDAVDVEDGFARLCGKLGAGDAEALISTPVVKQALIDNGQRAIEHGVFGVPTLRIDGELFWGYDATDMALDYLGNPERFLSEEMKRVDALPVGVTRT